MLQSERLWEMIDHFMSVIEAETHFPVLIYDVGGYIIRATDSSRIGDLHTGAEKIMRGLADEYAVTVEEAQSNPLIREGYSCPIVIDGQRVAGFGITGKLELTKPLARTAVRMIDSWLESHRYQEQLEWSEQKYRHLFDNALYGVFQATLDGRYLTANASMAAIFGYVSADELIADVTDISRQLYVHPDERMQLIDMLLNEGRVSGYVAQVRRRDGRTIHVSIDAQLIDSPDTGERYIEGHLADISERKQLEEMMIQNEKMLSVGGLAAGMAHEINNPLAGILQNIAVLENRLSGNLPANHAAAAAAGTTMDAIGRYIDARGLSVMLDNIRSSGKRAAGIVKNMLSFARKSEHVFSRHRIGDLLDQTIELVRTDYDTKKQYDFKKIRIVREYDETLDRVPCDAGKIQQVFLNILKNGAEAMADAVEQTGSPMFTVRVKRDGSWACVEIQDNGPGMDEKTRRRVFEPFYTSKPVGMGTGLGLSVSYFIITENHRGQLRAASTPGKGATFSIRLPLEHENTA